MEIFGIKFAPLRVPLERRLQTLAIAIWMLVIATCGLVHIALAIYILFFTKLWWLIILYVFWIWVVDKDISEKGGRPNKWVQTWVLWKYCREYYPVRLEKLSSVDLDPKRNYLFCAFPHGIICSGVFHSFTTDWGGFSNLFPHHRPHIVTLSINYFVPFLRDLALAMRGIASSAKSINHVLMSSNGGNVCVLLVGGAEEAFFSKPGCYRVVLKKRRGFVRLALKNGAPLVPVLSFGETDIFDQMEGPKLRRFQDSWRRLTGFSPIVPLGRGIFQYSFGLLPHRRKITTVVGVPVDVPKIDDPTDEQIDEYHAKFVESLCQMFEEQKYNYLDDPEDKYLIIE